MTDIKIRVENAKKVVTGNVSMLDMLETAPATELLNWGINLAEQLAQSASGMDDTTADQNMEPRMKALRQFLRGVGNWAAGKYDAASRPDLKTKMAEHWKLMFGKDAPADLGKLLNLVDDAKITPHQLILKLKEFLTLPK
ncbi:MAG TPA: hypothetical protein PKK96_09815 [Anaerolineales bacterium]|nr:hypothetical protein [Anaerolineales bacterium]HNQ94400.1 hypothetical protein [Anaerolineales bacterium]HNS61288.1 hypothetical protein [Anaerolineales bacterium]